MAKEFARCTVDTIKLTDAYFAAYFKGQTGGFVEDVARNFGTESPEFKGLLANVSDQQLLQELAAGGQRAYASEKTLPLVLRNINRECQLAYGTPVTEAAPPLAASEELPNAAQPSPGDAVLPEYKPGDPVVVRPDLVAQVGTPEDCGGKVGQGLATFLEPLIDGARADAQDAAAGYAGGKATALYELIIQAFEQGLGGQLPADGESVYLAAYEVCGAEPPQEGS